VITSQIRGIIVGGKPFAPESRQTRLAEKLNFIDAYLDTLQTS
jgi:hypothetical protein